MQRNIFEDEHAAFRDSVRTFLRREAGPRTATRGAAGTVGRSFWKKAAEAGFVGFEAPERWGGLGISDFRFNAILNEEVEYAEVAGDNFSLENDILAPYLLELTNEEQQSRWVPAFTSGDLVAAIAMSEPGAGSDLASMSTTAVRAGDEYVINGSKTFVTSGIQADLVIVAARTGKGSARGAFSLFAVEAGLEGFEPGRKLAKVGRRAQDTAELFFRDVHVPPENLLGREGDGFSYL